MCGNVQTLLDEVLTTRKFKTVTDLQYIPDEGLVFVKRKMGFKDTLVDIRKDKTDDQILTHLDSVPAIY